MSSMTQWLEIAKTEMSAYIKSKGYKTPEVDLNYGFTSSGARSSAVGECWPRSACSSGLNFILLRPTEPDPVKLLATLLHEYVHAIDDCKNRHNKEFKKIATSLGLTGPMRSTEANPELKVVLQSMLARIGKPPNRHITTSLKRRISVPTPKSKCPECEYTVSVPRKYVDFGVPICPVHKTPMTDTKYWKGLAE
jgi:hypothetical protein